MSKRLPFKVVKEKGSNIIVPIYRTPTVIKKDGKTTTYEAFLVRYYVGKQKFQFKRSTIEEATTEALAGCRAIAKADASLVRLSADQAAAWQRCEATALPFGKSVEQVVQDWAELRLLLRPGVEPIEAIRDYNRRQSADLVTKPIPEIIAEMLAAKKADGLSERHLRDLSGTLNRFASHFGTCPVRQILGTDIAQWIRSLTYTETVIEKKGETETRRTVVHPLSPRTRNNFRTALQNFASYCKANRYLPKDWDELASVATAKARIETIGIFTPSQLSKLLVAASERQLPFIALGAFAGIRHAELTRLHWEHIHFDSGHIEITAQNAKTAARRLVPILPNLLEWLLPYRNKTGQIFTSASYISDSLGQIARKAGVPWHHNGLRHSFISYRVADIQNVAQVALEAGNSPAKIFSNYRELVTKTDAQTYFAIRPGAGATVTNPFQKTGTDE